MVMNSQCPQIRQQETKSTELDRAKQHTCHRKMPIETNGGNEQKEKEIYRVSL